jgi:hypothetical protein
MSEAIHTDDLIIAEKTADDVRYQMRESRQQVVEAAGELKSRIADKVSETKERLDVAEFARRHPMVALAVAVAVGAYIASTGADEKAVESVKARAVDTLDEVKGLADRGSSESTTVGDERPAEPGPIGRFVGGQARMLTDELRRAAGEIGGQPG